MATPNRFNQPEPIEEFNDPRTDEEIMEDMAAEIALLKEERNYWKQKFESVVTGND